MHPDLEIGRFLAHSKTHCPPTLKVLGAVEYRADGENMTVGVLHEYVPNTTPAAQFVQDVLGRYFEQIMALAPEERPTAPPAGSLWDLASGEASPVAKHLLGSELEWAAALGRRTAELHVALTSRANADFAPEPFTQLYQRSLYQSARKSGLRALQKLRAKLKDLPETAQPMASLVLEAERSVVEKFRGIVGQKISAHRIRCHGCYDLRHVLYTGKDFLIVDFGGEAGPSFSTRRVKRCPLDDVAAMIHSLRSAASEAMLQLPKTGIVTPEAAEAWREAAEFWSGWTASAFLRAYIANPGVAVLVPSAGDPLARLLEFHLLQEAVEHLQVELDGDELEEVTVPLDRILALVQE